MLNPRRTYSLPFLLTIAAATVVTAIAASPAPATATCGDVPPAATLPQEARSITASDALAALQTAVGIRTCALCICDVNDSGTVTATDALAVLRAAVGQSVTLDCPSCGEGPDSAVLAAAYCDFVARCQPVLLDYRHWTLESCTTGTRADIERGAMAVADAIEAGRTDFVAEDFEACLSAYENNDCDLELTDECTYLHGNRSKNQGCSISPECADNLFCDVPSPPGCGLCHDRATLGQDCSTKVCVQGADCLDVIGSAVCVANDLEEGDPCGTVETGLCRGQMMCGGPEDTCLRPAKLDETCDEFVETGPTCAIYQQTDCVNDQCVELVIHTAGGACNVGGVLCDVNSRCDFVSSKCIALPGVGQTCNSNFGCASGLYCGSNAKCAPLGDSGDACTSIGQCLTGLLCAGPQGSRTCQAPVYGACP